MRDWDALIATAVRIVSTAWMGTRYRDGRSPRIGAGVTLLGRLLRDRSGAMFAEYALILALLCGGVACIAYFFGHAISDAMIHAGELISKEWEGIYSNKPIT